MQTQIRRHGTRHLIWVSTVCIRNSLWKFSYKIIPNNPKIGNGLYQLIQIGGKSIRLNGFSWWTFSALGKIIEFLWSLFSILVLLAVEISCSFMFSLAKHGKSFITSGPDQVWTKLFGTVIVFRKDFILKKKVNFEFKKKTTTKNQTNSRRQKCMLITQDLNNGMFFVSYRTAHFYRYFLLGASSKSRFQIRISVSNFGSLT